MLFETESSAKRFIQFNAEEILEEEGKAPEKSEESSVEPTVEKNNADENKKKENVAEGKIENPVSQSQEQIHDKVREMAGGLDRRIQPMFDELNASIENIEKLKSMPRNILLRIMVSSEMKSPKELF